MSVIFEGIEMPKACCFVDGEHSSFAHFEYCRFYNVCKQRETVKTNYKPSDCPIKALEQEPTTKNNLGVDAISRAEVLKLMQDNWHTHNGDWAMQESMDDIRALPAVTPQPRKGHWMDTNDNAFVPFRVYKCSHCGATFCDYPKNIKKHKYCSDCGTKMVEPQESEVENGNVD